MVVSSRSRSCWRSLLDLRVAGARGGRRLHAFPRCDLARGAAGRRFARDVRSVTAGLEPDYKLPDLILPGRPATGAPSQAEFVQVPADYLKEAASRGWRLKGSG